jgi:hypothetical protein
VAERVVDALEAVEVEQDDGGVVPGLSAAGREPRAVREAGQRVGEGGRPQLALELGARGHVDVDAEVAVGGPGVVHER